MYLLLFRNCILYRCLDMQKLLFWVINFILFLKERNISELFAKYSSRHRNPAKCFYFFRPIYRNNGFWYLVKQYANSCMYFIERLRWIYTFCCMRVLIGFVKSFCCIERFNSIKLNESLYSYIVCHIKLNEFLAICFLVCPYNYLWFLQSN